MIYIDINILHQNGDCIQINALQRKSDRLLANPRFDACRFRATRVMHSVRKFLACLWNPGQGLVIVYCAAQ